MDDIMDIITHTWLRKFATEVQCWGFCIADVVSLTKVNVVDSSCTLVVVEGGPSLMTHNTKAEGMDVPEKIKQCKTNHEGISRYKFS